MLPTTDVTTTQAAIGIKKHSANAPETTAPVTWQNRPIDNHLAVNGYRPVEDAVHAEYGGLGRVDDWRTEQRAEHSAVADRERTAVHVLDG